MPGDDAGIVVGVDERRPGFVDDALKDAKVTVRVRSLPPELAFETLLRENGLRAETTDERIAIVP